MAFTERTSKPGAGNKNFIRTATGGWNTCIQGNPTDRDCNVLANCVGGASGRFNEIINQVRGTSGCAYKTLNCNAERALAAGLKIGSTPRVGAIMCWQKGSLSSSDGAGHVAVVERVYSPTSVYTSESGYGSKAFWNQTRNKGNGSWGLGGTYKFRCFIYLPDDVQAAIGTSLPESKPVVDNNKSIDELAREVIAGKYGNGQARKDALGSKYNEVQARVNEILAGNQPAPAPQPAQPSFDLLEAVKKTIRGDYGNGQARKNALGSHYSEVQRQVNLNYQHGTTRWDNIRLY